MLSQLFLFLQKVEKQVQKTLLCATKCMPCHVNGRTRQNRKVVEGTRGIFFFFSQSNLQDGRFSFKRTSLKSTTKSSWLIHDTVQMNRTSSLCCFLLYMANSTEANTIYAASLHLPSALGKLMFTISNFNLFRHLLDND